MSLATEVSEYLTHHRGSALDHEFYPDALVASVLEGTRAVALVGASADPARPSNRVMAWWLRRGVGVVPVNPGLAGRDILGRRVVASLAEVPSAPDLVDVFRKSDAVGTVIDDVLAMRPPPRVVWMQLGVRDDDAAARAEAAGIVVIMDRCPAIEASRLARAR